MRYGTVGAPPVLYRVGRLPDPLAWRPPREPLEPSNDPVLGGGRWDDPSGEFATLYCATTELGAFMEVLAPLRPVGGILDRILRETSEEDPDPYHDPTLSTGVVSPRLFAHWRGIGRVEPQPHAYFVDMAATKSHNALNLDLSGLLGVVGAPQFARGVVMHHDRRLTRSIAGHLHRELPEASGLRFESRVDAFECWALWENREAVAATDVDPVDPASPMLHRAAERLGITLDE